MKITRLRIAGFGPYKTEQEVDFTRFDADGIFLITGKTGAGKSSILDAICFALYGSVPRFDGSELRLRSDHCDPADPSFVELEFTLKGDTYRVYRTPRYEKAKKRGVGTTTAQPDARLERFSAGTDGTGDWVGIAARPVDVGTELSRILPLKQDQFLQVILLAQNRFQRFLLAKTDDRLTVLRTLFGTLRFQQLETELLTRRKVLDDELTLVRHEIDGIVAATLRQLWRDDDEDTRPESPADPHLGWFDAALDTLDSRLAAATRHAETASAALTAATAEYQAAEDRRRRQDRRDAAARTLTALEERGNEMLGSREALRLAEHAARVWPQVRARIDADAAVGTAEATATAARAAWKRLVDDDADSADAAGLSTLIDDRLRQLGSLDDLLVEERRLPALDQQITDLERRTAAQIEALDAAKLLLLALPERIDAATDALAAATLGAARAPEAEATLARAEAALAAADDVRRLETELVGVHRAEREAVAENTAAALHYQQLVDARLGGFAVELAAGLVDGEPCAVCGATEHPAPMTGDAAPVTEDDLDDARDLMSRRQGAVDAARTQSRDVDTLLTAARTRAGDDDADTLDSALRQAEDALAVAADHRARLPALEAELSRLRVDQAEAQAALAPLQLARDEATVHLAERRTERDGIASRVQAQRAGFDSVTERAGRLHSELDAARALADALATSASARRAAEARTEALAAQLHEEGFADEAAAGLARLSPAEMQAGQAAIRAYDDDLAGARGVLAETDLAGLPENPIDLDPTRLALQAAGAARDDALARRESLRERATALTALVGDARARFALAADLLTTQAQVRQLAAVVHGDDPNTKRMKLETYVLAAQLEEIIAAANNRLRTMTGGRYALEHDDALQYRGSQAGLGLAIRDEHTGRARATHSLSGGETFLASLALALGLAEVVSNQAGGIALDTLFVDEGFGSLDAETLETAMSTLDSLRAGGRTIGLISHVESMKEQIPAKLAIRVTAQGYSEIIP
ncbi:MULTISPECIES: AAA family ATPase [unclassified Cryobacterium]|uniref:AAA family ATPase n=5 Tax=Cryobacterium TaxID=69578 RepID=UPI00106A3EA0|nr:MULTISPECIES: AAA family ATPase [unclassified Cryobacterium]TFC78423.1 SMC family ATPase [Cryobacterium sp. TMB3-10]TFD44480.1 SMC family ATPase [Cryobacterium sp. TMB3-12]